MITNKTEVMENLIALGNILNVDVPKDLKGMVKYLCNNITNLNELVRARKYIEQNHVKQSYPKIGDFFRALKEAPVNTETKRYFDWQYEYANKLNIPVEQFVLMRVSDLTDKQKDDIGALKSEEVKFLFKQIKKIRQKETDEYYDFTDKKFKKLKEKEKQLAEIEAELPF
eukprot:GHVR01127004.1.p1 GENE.GHVR01127004.1~~GHVR01127004.1.p1  ORF type:complete len:170 (+),score=33.46 GHVR01127004.1:337-846(+)